MILDHYIIETPIHRTCIQHMRLYESLFPTPSTPSCWRFCLNRFLTSSKATSALLCIQRSLKCSVDRLSSCPQVSVSFLLPSSSNAHNALHARFVMSKVKYICILLVCLSWVLLPCCICWLQITAIQSRMWRIGKQSLRSHKCETGSQPPCECFGCFVCFRFSCLLLLSFFCLPACWQFVALFWVLYNIILFD